MTAPAASERSPRRWPLVVIAVLGVGLVAAPSIFQMFDRAPGGGEMLVDFEPYMQLDTIEGFRDDLTTIGAARDEATAAIEALPADQQARFRAVAAFDEAWPGLDADMRSMLDDMEHNIGNYRGVKALPPFAAFPWFFVIPGVLLAAVAGVTLVADAGRPPARGRRIALLCLAGGLVAAPVVFQMFTRAPGGAEMIDDFRPFMTEEKVGQVQGYFLAIGGGESELRRAVVPAVAAAAGTSPEAVLPAVHTLSREWPSIAAEMAPMVGTMADNVDNFGGIAALPPFSLFPWFFVIPGVAVGVLAWRSRDLVVTPIDHAWRSRSLPLSRRDLGRAVAGVTAIVVVVALAVITIQNGTRSATTTTSRSGSPAARPAGSELVRAAPTPTNPPRPRSAPVPAPTVLAGAAGAALPRDTTEPPAAPTSPAPRPAVTPLTCPLPLAVPPDAGGVASLTPLVPLFGPFAPEAFAMLPAFEPLLRLFGPLLVAGQPWFTMAEPLTSAATPAVRQLEEGGFAALGAVYGPYRSDVLAAEADFATQLGVLMDAVVTTPGGGCIPALEALLLASAPG